MTRWPRAGSVTQRNGVVYYAFIDTFWRQPRQFDSSSYDSGTSLSRSRPGLGQRYLNSEITTTLVKPVLSVIRRRS